MTGTIDAFGRRLDDCEHTYLPFEQAATNAAGDYPLSSGRVIVVRSSVITVRMAMLYAKDAAVPQLHIEIIEYLRRIPIAALPLDARDIVAVADKLTLANTGTYVFPKSYGMTTYLSRPQGAMQLSWQNIEERLVTITLLKTEWQRLVEGARDMIAWYRAEWADEHPTS